jgi:NAD(P)-dependent dehydrogenase (short-subunit alcohol dehydrogenase family)
MTRQSQTTVLVIGANRGIGKALVEETLRRGVKRVYAALAVCAIGWAPGMSFHLAAQTLAGPQSAAASY